jgi:hypothetical protein
MNAQRLNSAAFAARLSERASKESKGGMQSFNSDGSASMSMIRAIPFCHHLRARCTLRNSL